jgi:creatinine amidohydrolase
MLTFQNTAWDFAPTPQMAILPLACFEPHGPHLPVGTDLLIMEALAARVAGQWTEPVFLLPTWPYGTSLPQDGQPGAISLAFETLWAVVRDTVVSLHQHGIHQVVALNNHGAAMPTTRPLGNFIVKTAVRQLNYETPGLSVIWVQPFAAARKALTALFDSAGHDIHAGAVETSLLLHLAPALVGELPPNFFPAQSPTWLDLVPYPQLAPAGVWGAPQQASAEKGAQAFDAVVDATTQYIRRAFEQITAHKAQRGISSLQECTPQTEA